MKHNTMKCFLSLALAATFAGGALAPCAHGQIEKLAPTQSAKAPASARALMPRGAISLFARDVSRAFGRPVLIHVWAVNNPIAARYSQVDVLVPVAARRSKSKSNRRPSGYKRRHSFKLPWIYAQDDETKGGPPTDLQVRSAFLNAKTKRGPVVVMEYHQTFEGFTQVLTFPSGLNGRGFLNNSQDEGSPDGGVTFVPDLDESGNFYLRSDENNLGTKSTRRFKWNGKEYTAQ